MPAKTIEAQATRELTVETLYCEAPVTGDHGIVKIELKKD